VLFQERTVIVVGAGASCELNLPAGDQLMTKIMQALAPNRNAHGFGNEPILQALVAQMTRDHGHGWAAPMARYREAAKKIVTALPYARSIDTYLNSQQDDDHTVLLGKLAITQAILEAERHSYLRRSNVDQAGAIDSKGLTASWYIPLARILTSGHRADDIDKLFDNVSFIVFNYDRCLELFLYRMVVEYFAVDQASAQQAIGRATIVHAYGSVGDLFKRNGENSTVPFGGGDGVDLEQVALGIKTYTESADEGTTAAIRTLVREAETLVFLGFGFLAQNMDLLDPGEGSGARRVFATAYNISNQDAAAIEHKMVQKFGEVERVLRLQDLHQGKRRKHFDLTFESGTCRNLMDNNIFSLADQ
jgi:hypothetical protein